MSSDINKLIYDENVPENELIQSNDNISNIANRSYNTNNLIMSNGFPKTTNGFSRKNMNINNNFKNSKINWRNVRNLDLDLIRSSNDVSSLQRILQNLVYSEITEEEIGSVPEQNLSKLIKIYQFTIDFLAGSQDSLEYEKNYWQSQCQKTAGEIEEKENELTKARKLINKLKFENKNDQTVLLTYKNAIKSLTKKKLEYVELNEHNINITEQKQTNNNNNQQSSCCPFCTAKISDLGRHIKDVHLLNNNINTNNNNIPNPSATMPSPTVNYVYPPMNNDLFEKQMEYIIRNNNECNECLRKMQEETYRQIQANKDNNCKNYIDAMEKLENNFKESLNNIKEMFIKGLEKNIPPPQIIEKEVKKEVVPAYDDELKKKMNVIHDEISQNNLESKERMEKLEEEIKKLKLQQTEIKVYNSDKEKLISSPPKNNIIVKNPDLVFKAIKKPQPKQIVDIKEQIIPDNLNKRNEEEKKSLYEFQTCSKLFMNVNELNPRLDQESKKEIIYLNEPEKPKTVYNFRRKPAPVNPEEPLDNFYKRYTKRDKGYIKNPKYDMYHKKVLPEDIEEDPQKTNKIMDNNMSKTIVAFFEPSKTIANPNMDLKMLAQQDEAELVNICKDMFKKMEIENKGTTKDKKFIENYYESIKVLLDFDKMKDNLKKISKTIKYNNLKHSKISLLNPNRDSKITEINKLNNNSSDIINESNINTNKIEDKNPPQKKIQPPISSEFNYTSDEKNNIKNEQKMPTILRAPPKTTKINPIPEKENPSLNIVDISELPKENNNLPEGYSSMQDIQGKNNITNINLGIPNLTQQPQLFNTGNIEEVGYTSNTVFNNGLTQPEIGYSVNARENQNVKVEPNYNYNNNIQKDINFNQNTRPEPSCNYNNDNVQKDAMYNFEAKNQENNDNNNINNNIINTNNNLNSNINTNINTNINPNNNSNSNVNIPYSYTAQEVKINNEQINDDTNNKEPDALTRFKKNLINATKQAKNKLDQNTNKKENI